MDPGRKKLTMFEEFSSNPFIEKRQIEVMDMDFMISLSKPSMKIVRYLVYKEAYTDEKFVFDVDEFNKISGYKFGYAPFNGFIELCSKGLLARTKNPFVFWVNRGMLNTGAFSSAHGSNGKDKKKA